MKGWVKGILIGGIFGIIWALSPYILYFLHILGWELNNPTISQFISFPALFAVKLGFAFHLVFIGAPLVAITIGVVLGVLISLLIQCLNSVLEKIQNLK